MAAPVEEKVRTHFKEFSDGESSISPEIRRVSTPISYREFFRDFLLPNKPCIFCSWLTEDWKCSKKWKRKVRHSLDRVLPPGAKLERDEIDLTFFGEQYGHTTVPVAECAKQEFDAHPKIEMKLADYLEYLKSGDPERVLYLKDWHFQREFSEDPVYNTPVYFRSDWLNELCDAEGRDDYKFLYLGPRGSWTPFHADVFRSFSWSANIVGRKRWIILPPGEEEKLRDTNGKLPFDVWPSLIGREDVTWYDVTQEAGEVIFIPSGWHHQVHNLEMTLSLNHNWYNGCNVVACWRHLAASLGDVEREVEDWRDSMGHEFLPHCQMMLRALSGVDYADFFHMLRSTAQKRLNLIRDAEHQSSFIEYTPSAIEHMLSAIEHTPSAIKHTPSAIEHTPSAIEHTPSAIKHTPSAIEHTPSAIEHTPSAIEHTHSAIEHTPSVIEHTPSVIQHTPSAIEHPPPAIEHTPASIEHPPNFSSEEEDFMRTVLDVNGSKMTHYEFDLVRICDVLKLMLEDEVVRKLEVGEKAQRLHDELSEELLKLDLESPHLAI